ncbi:SMI1/KNR4 family protein [Bacillus sp. CLL-7-23]|uniref:SMI1/KNR4 family protein n=1 Tax=Bacillus changyiensis TaxID=3004103 RepID=A0ABT4X6R0_9BACI|nr:SMI1/KNR4 family protein [Bacillus changyiensis]MDA7027419.1 SMI1/KNR4 family protein [Bacillus changyiensis]
MKIELEYSFKSVTAADIEAFENKYNIFLPIDYKEFLIFHNGGKTGEKSMFKTNDPTKEGKITSYIMLFFPLSDESATNLEEKYQLYNKGNIIPKNFFPIGEDPCENLICMSIEGKDVGSIYHCEMDYFDYLKEKKELEQNHIRLVSKSFLEFIKSLT